MKEFSIKEKAAMKRIAANVDGYIQKKARILAKMDNLQRELDIVQSQIDMMEAPLKAMTGGYGVLDVFTKTIVDTGKSKIPKFEFIYDTVIPQEEQAEEEIIPEEINL